MKSFLFLDIVHRYSVLYRATYLVRKKEIKFLEVQEVNRHEY